MASTYSTNLALELIGTGDQAGTWGNTTNTNLGTLIEQAISGYVTQAVSTGTDTTLTIPNGATGVARNMYIELTGTGGTNTNLVVPANKKLYFIYNNASGAVTVKVSGQTGVSVAAGQKVILVSNGTDVVEATTYLASNVSSLSLTNLTASSATITNLLGTTLTISGNSFLATSSGNVGIGTSSPSTKLSISGGNIFVDNANGSVIIRNADATNQQQIRLRMASNDGVLDVTRASGTAPNLIFGTEGSEKMRLDSSGNLGLGVTPSTYSYGKALQVNGAAFSGDSTTWRARMTANAYYDGDWKYLQDNHALEYLQSGSAGSHTWNIAASGTANNIITWTSAMTLDASGQLALGRTSVTDLGANIRTVDMDGTSGAGFRLRANGTNIANIYAVSSAVYMAAPANVPIVFETNNTERARITDTGNLLVGTTTDVSGRSGVISDVAGNVRAIPRTGSAKTSNYTLAITDVGQFVELGTNGIITVPNGVFSTGDVVSVFNNTSAARPISLTITTAYIGGTDSDKASVSLATRGVATILFISNSVCVVNGNVS